jgi:hypothetical protein
MKVIINVPVVVDCDIRSVPQSEESVFNVDHTDFAELTNIQMPAKLTIAASNITIVGE